MWILQPQNPGYAIASLGAKIAFGALPPWGPVFGKIKIQQNSYFYISKNSENKHSIHGSITHMCVNFQDGIR